MGKKHRFIDHVTLEVHAGKGGAGSVHFRRARFMPKGGPDGGDGGRGGHVILEGNRNEMTLANFRYGRPLVAAEGKPGEANQRKGADAKDLIVKVPLGCVVKKSDSKLLGEITHHQDRMVVAHGGKGGLGNTHFKTAVRQAPHYAQPGEPGTSLTISLELKLLADIGLVGMPNAGKSTLLSILSAARPKIGNYPFTTLTPNLGVVKREHHSLVLADIPGLIEGASQGKGLGIQFLRHIERTQVLLFTLAIDEEPVATYQLLRQELQKHNPLLLQKKRMIAITKTDLSEDEVALQPPLRQLSRECDVVCVSALAHQGLASLTQKLTDLLDPKN